MDKPPHYVIVGCGMIGVIASVHAFMDTELVLVTLNNEETLQAAQPIAFIPLLVAPIPNICIENTVVSIPLPSEPCGSMFLTVLPGLVDIQSSHPP